MANEDADIHELRPRLEGHMDSIQDRWVRKDQVRIDLVRENKRLNRQTIGRIARGEVGGVLPALEEAIAKAEEARHLRSIAVFAGDSELEQELGVVLRSLADAAEPLGRVDRRQS
jgi:hypothetical protein